MREIALYGAIDMRKQIDRDEIGKNTGHFWGTRSVTLAHKGKVTNPVCQCIFYRLEDSAIRKPFKGTPMAAQRLLYLTLFFYLLLRASCSPAYISRLGTQLVSPDQYQAGLSPIHEFNHARRRYMMLGQRLTDSSNMRLFCPTFFKMKI